MQTQGNGRGPGSAGNIAAGNGRRNGSPPTGGTGPGGPGGMGGGGMAGPPGAGMGTGRRGRGMSAESRGALARAIRYIGRYRRLAFLAYGSLLIATAAQLMVPQ